MPEHVLKMVDDIGNGPDDPATQRMLILIYEAHMTDGKQVIFSLTRRIERIPPRTYVVQVKKSKHSRERYSVESDDLADAICAAYCAYHQIDIDSAVLEGA